MNNDFFDDRRRLGWDFNFAVVIFDHLSQEIDVPTMKRKFVFGLKIM